MALLLAFVSATLGLALDAAPWLLLGLVLAAVTLLLGLLTEGLVTHFGLRITPVVEKVETASPLAWGALVGLVLLTHSSALRRGRG